MQRTVPTYQLYGEYLAGDDAYPIHYEPIKERSRHHDWRIQPHRHENLVQIFYFQNSGIEIETEETNYLTKGPTIMLAPPMTVHGFKFPENVVGDVISLRLQGLDLNLQEKINDFEHGTATILSENEVQFFGLLKDLIKQFRTVYKNIFDARSELLAGIIDLLLLCLQKEKVSAITPYGSRLDQTLHETQIHKFCSAVEEHFSEDLKVNDFATMLDCSAPHLTRISNKILSCTPNEFIKRRRIIEAKRLLKFTRHSIEEIALRSGYRDIGYFSKSFKKNVGQTPSEYRKHTGH